MAKKKKQLPAEYQKWIDARKRFHLSHAQVQMARELGLNPKKFGSLANHKQEPWKAPLPVFIGRIYFKRFKKETPDKVMPVEKIYQAKKQKKAERKQQRQENHSKRNIDKDAGDGNTTTP
jgi:hypothetical protein